MKFNVDLAPESKVAIIERFVSDLQNNKIEFKADESGHLEMKWAPEITGNITAKIS